MTEQIYAGNIVSYFIIALEQFWINGLWAGWGQLAYHFKNNGYFIEYCDNFNTTLEDCTRRDELFNEVYTMAGIIYGAGSFVFGVASDRVGIVISRCASLLLATTGLTVLVLLLNRQIDEVTGIWCAWPLIAVGGLGNHISNIRCSRTTPLISATLMYMMSGCLGASASVILIFERISHDLDIAFADIFMILTICYAAAALINLIFFTPTSLPARPVSMSLFENAYFMRCCRKSGENEPVNATESASQSSLIKTVITNWRIYVILIAISSWIVRRVTHQSWLGSGWPQWVVADNDEIDGDAFDLELNRMQSIAYFTLVGFNLIPGIIVDRLTKKYAKDSNPMNGRALGLSLCFSIAAVFLITQSILQSFPNYICAYAAIVVHTLGRMWGTGCWNPLYYYLFPPEAYGLVFGVQTLGSLPFQYLAIPMFDYIQANENDFATMNFAIAGMLCSLFAVPVVIWTRSRQIEQENKHPDKVSRDTETEM